MEFREPEGSYQGFGVSGEKRGAVPRYGLRGFANASVVEGQDLVAGCKERRELGAPGSQVVGEAVDEDDGFGIGRSLEGVVDCDIISLDEWHGCYQGGWTG